MPVIREYWPLVLENLRQHMSVSNYKAWFSRLGFVSTGNNGRKIILSVPSAFNRNYIETKFKTQLREAISKYYPQVIHIDYKIVEEEFYTQDEQDTEHMEEVIGAVNYSVATEVVEDVAKVNQRSSYLPNPNLNNLNPKYTFENFVVTGNNELAVSVSKSVIKQPGSLYNPIFLYGGVGLGKTHLLQAVGQKMLEIHPNFNIKYIPCETFVNQFLLAMQKRRMDEFRDYYRTIDLLLIDDIQFIAGKEATQEAFFHTFNELHQHNKQIILTSDRAPKSLGGIAERLVSRFEWGMVVDISQPEIEDRIAIITDKVQRLGLQLDIDHVTMIAQHINSNIREVEGFLNRIKAKLSLQGDITPTHTDLEHYLKEYLGSSPIQIKPNLSLCTPDRILQSICRVYSISKADILGPRRQKNLSEARQMCFWFFKQELSLSYPVIGKMFGGRDHTTVMHGVSKVEKMIKEEDKIKMKISLVRDLLISQ